ncbi:unnamed protein product [Hermetia illucens]|uniref:Cytochrome P450 n=2 Tax=Hermetia illucens TaxID=343691 RepID=A0A7R8YP01_HERIL|nr:unnamed protein product [Hermetia illucens]
MAFLIIFCSLLVTVLSGVYLIFKLQYRYWIKRGVPCFAPKFPFGTLRLHGKRRHLKETLDDTYREFKLKVPFAGMYFFSTPVPLILDLDLIHNILIKDFCKFHDRGLYYNERDDPLSANLLTLEGHKWKTLRSKLTPTFTLGKMKFMYPTILEVMNQFEQTLRELIKIQADVEIKDLLARFTTDVIGTCAFGIECNSLKDPNTEFRRMGKSVFQNKRHGVLGRALMTQLPGLARKLGVKDVGDDVSYFFLKVVRETIEFREKNNVRRNDFMDLLIQLKNGSSSHDGEEKLSFEEIAAQAFVFFVAGFETSSSNMTYSLYELAKDPDIQEKARRQINDTLKEHGGEFTYDALQEMTYIDQVINESLRKYPAAILLLRTANCDYQVPNSDKVIEKGTRVFIPLYSIHHDPDIYPNPEMFDPGRFAPEEVKKRHPMAFLAFGSGPRNCIGARFGRLQSRIGLASLLRKFRFKTCSKTPAVLEYSLTSTTLAPVGGMCLSVEAIGS